MQMDDCKHGRPWRTNPVLQLNTPIPLVAAALWTVRAGKDADLVGYGAQITSALATYHSWSVYDVAGLTQAAVDQRLQFLWDERLHFLPAMHDQMDDVLLNVLCPV